MKSSTKILLLCLLGTPSAYAQPIAQPPTNPPPPAGPENPPAAAPAPPAPPPPPAAEAPIAPTPPPPPPAAAAPPPPAPEQTPGPQPLEGEAPTTAADAFPGPAAPMQVTTPSATIRLGLLLQPQYEAVGNARLHDLSSNLYVRRARILVGGTLYKVVEYFLETDYPDLFKASTTNGATNTPGLNIQDAFVTLKPLEDVVKLDAGYMFPPLSRNALQSAAWLYSWDYFANTFRHGAVFNSSGNPVGRDAGVQLRGLLIGSGLLEYRIGMYQGRRRAPTANEVGSQGPFRFAGRIQLNLLDAESTFFYSGGYLGKKHILSFGASYDFQKQYKHWSVDGLVDLPLGPGVLTAQVDYAFWSGRGWVDLPRQNALMGEAGYLINFLRLSPIFRAERRWVTHPSTTTPEETRIGGGLAFWPFGHNLNFKVFYARVDQDPGRHLFDQLNMQLQLFVY